MLLGPAQTQVGYGQGFLWPALHVLALSAAHCSSLVVSKLLTLGGAQLSGCVQQSSHAYMTAVLQASTSGC
jgi:hypothetical protein